MVDVNTFGTGGICEDDCLAAAVRKAYDLTPAGIIKQFEPAEPHLQPHGGGRSLRARGFSVGKC